MSDRLKTLAVEYSQIEDRLRFRALSSNDVEFQFWITRRIVNMMWGGLLKALEKSLGADSQSSEARKAMLSMHHQGALETREFAHTKKRKPANEKPIPLATTVKIGNRANGAVQLTFITDTRKEYGLKLPEDSVHALCHLIQNATKKAKWELDLQIGDESIVARPPTSNVH